MVQSRAKRIKNEIQKIKKTLINPVQKKQRYRDKSENLCGQGWKDSADAYDRKASYNACEIIFNLNEAEDLLTELEDEAFWLCTFGSAFYSGVYHLNVCIS